MCSRQIGKPRVRWLDDMCNELKVLNVKNWKELTLNKLGMVWLRSQNSQRVLIYWKKKKE
jgi:hypothetical protein